MFVNGRHKQQKIFSLVQTLQSIDRSIWLHLSRDDMSRFIKDIKVGYWPIHLEICPNACTWANIKFQIVSLFSAAGLMNEMLSQECQYN